LASDPGFRDVKVSSPLPLHSVPHAYTADVTF
jgi:hypothetical protein